VTEVIELPDELKVLCAVHANALGASLRAVNLFVLSSIFSGKCAYVTNQSGIAGIAPSGRELVSRTLAVSTR
jgi:hypothetical protein